ncbi:MAG TPA: hypothetical protein PKC30_13240 [Saprospiraceae bacterium]|nr:hypothetical protein [Saprospiraceae bacterium]
MKIHSQQRINKDYLPESTLRGSSVIIIVVGGMLILFLFMLKLNNSVIVEAEILDEEQPHPVFSLHHGVFRPLVRDGEAITTGQWLGYFEMDYDFGNIMLFYQSIKKWNNDSLVNEALKKYMTLSSFSSLPELIEEPVIRLKLSLLEYVVFVKHEEYLHRTRLQNFEIASKAIREEILKREIIDSLNRSFTQISGARSRRDSLLFSSQIISEMDAEFSSMEILREIRSIYEKQIDKVRTEREYNQLNWESREEVLRFNSLKDQLLNRIIDEFHNVRSRFDIWKSRFIVTAEYDGVVSIPVIYNRYQTEINDVLMTIFPLKGTGNYSVYLKVPRDKITYIKSGNKASIRVDEYPYMEFGTIQSEITHIPLESDGDFYICRAQLEQNLITNYKIELRTRTRYAGVAEVSLRKESLADKIGRLIFWKYTDYKT